MTCRPCTLRIGPRRLEMVIRRQMLPARVPRLKKTEFELMTGPGTWLPCLRKKVKYYNNNSLLRNSISLPTGFDPGSRATRASVGAVALDAGTKPELIPLRSHSALKYLVK